MCLAPPALLPTYPQVLLQCPALAELHLEGCPALAHALIWSDALTSLDLLGETSQQQQEAWLGCVCVGGEGCVARAGTNNLEAASRVLQNGEAAV
jgi:hypothetical protein